MALSLTVIIPTKNRARMIQALLESMRNLAGLDHIRPQIIVADNNSEDSTWEVLQEITSDFPVPITVIKVYKPGKSAVINEAVRLAKGSMIAFLDDDVTTDRGWLQAVERFASQGGFQVGQGRIQLQSPDADDPEVQRLIERFRTISKLDFDHTVQRVHSLNGANFTALRKALDRVGLFDERLGPGASGTSEDVELARRFARAGIVIGYMREAIAYHHVDRARLTEEYFRSIHKKQGKSRLVLKDRSVFHILSDLCRMSLQYGIDSLVAKERRRYRSKGRIYHYLGMLEAKLNPDPAVAGENKERDASLPHEQTDRAADILD
jgi:glucosyl-dolichyl phosphate glucuronosyltransferase